MGGNWLSTQNPSVLLLLHFTVRKKKGQCCVFSEPRIRHDLIVSLLISLEIVIRFRILQELFSGAMGGAGESAPSPGLLLGFRKNTGIIWNITSSACGISGTWSLTVTPSVSQGPEVLGLQFPKAPSARFLFRCHHRGALEGQRLTATVAPRAKEQLYPLQLMAAVTSAAARGRPVKHTCRRQASEIIVSRFLQSLHLLLLSNDSLITNFAPLACQPKISWPS